MHGADWLPTLASMAGLDLSQSLPLDGLSHWAALTGAADSPSPVRRSVTLGNSTNACSWPKGDPRRSKYEVLPAAAQALGCGFAIRADDLGDGRAWKLVRGYGGGPDTWCNSTSGQVDDVTPSHASRAALTATTVGHRPSATTTSCLRRAWCQPSSRRRGRS